MALSTHLQLSQNTFKRLQFWVKFTPLSDLTSEETKAPLVPTALVAPRYCRKILLKNKLF